MLDVCSGKAAEQGHFLCCTVPLKRLPHVSAHQLETETMRFRAVDELAKPQVGLEVYLYDFPSLPPSAPLPPTHSLSSFPELFKHRSFLLQHFANQPLQFQLNADVFAH